MGSEGTGIIGRAIAAAFQSPFSFGGTRGHNPNYEGLVDTVYLGCWPRHVFDRIGMFDEELVRNQDDEFNLRLLGLAVKFGSHPESGAGTRRVGRYTPSSSSTCNTATGKYGLYRNIDYQLQCGTLFQAALYCR